MAKKKSVTLRTIAEELGLTVHTVSKALRGLPGMSAATRKQIVETARRLGYQTKEQSAGMSAERIPWVSASPKRFVILMNGDFLFQQQQIEGLQMRLNELGHTLYPLLIPRSLTKRETLEDWLEHQGVGYIDGLFLTASLSEEIETIVLELPVPKVLIGYPPELAEVDSVIWDVEYAVHRSVKALYDAGHRNILYVGDIEPLRGFRLRWSAFKAACRKMGLDEPDPAEHITSDSWDRSAWMERIRHRLGSGRYSAVLCAIPDTSEWVHAAIGSLGWRVPSDISMVGMEHVDKPHIANLSRPILLTREAGERAAELMLRRIANPTLPYEQVRLKGPFHDGETIRRISHHGE